MQIALPRGGKGPQGDDTSASCTMKRRRTMKDKETLHRRVQELVDCFATTDPLKEMSMLQREGAGEEAPLKWLALAVLHGINGGAKKISLIRSPEGDVRVVAEYWKAELPTPGDAVGRGIFESLRRITHLEGEKGKTPLVVGIREGSIDLEVEIEKERESEKISLKFPEIFYTGEQGKSASHTVQRDLNYCRFAADAEHERAYHEEEPCDDARTGDYEKRIGDEKKVR